MCNILLHYTRANCICCICIHLYSCMCVYMCIQYILYAIYIYTPIHACTHWYMLEYFDTGRLADAGDGWCLVTVLISEAASHFWFKTSTTAADWTKHIPLIIPLISNTTFPNITNHPKKNILRFKSDALQQFINLQPCSFWAFDEELHGYPIHSSSANLHQYHTQLHRACASANGRGSAGKGKRSERLQKHVAGKELPSVQGLSGLLCFPFSRLPCYFTCRQTDTSQAPPPPPPPPPEGVRAEALCRLTQMNRVKYSDS